MASFNSSAWSGSVWRMVEAQHTASTMKIVDDPKEQDILEFLLETSKPVTPFNASNLDYLLATPFRYSPMRPGSRFRDITDPGVFYGAESVYVAGAELGFWRWKFLKDAVDLQSLAPVAHTAFSADVSTRIIDLRMSPYVEESYKWMHPKDYGATQALAKSARAADVGGIQYQSVRNPSPAWCFALLTPLAFAKPKPNPLTQTWWVAVHKDGVIWRRDGESILLNSESWN